MADSDKTSILEKYAVVSKTHNHEGGSDMRIMTVVKSAFLMLNWY